MDVTAQKADAFDNGDLPRVNHQVRSLRRLIRRVDACEHFDLSQTCALVEPLNVPLLTQRQWRADKNLRKWDSVGLTDCSQAAPLGSERRNERANGDDARLSHQFGSLASPAYIFNTIGFGKAQISAQAVPQVVSIKDEAMPATLLQPMLDANG